MITPELFDPILKQNEHLIENFSYITPDVKKLATTRFSKASASDKARVKNMDVSIYAS
jgi:hypothetical protein